jgi:Protein of unknown function (DUF2905)
LLISKWLIGLGVVLIAAGLLWPLLWRLGLGRLFGDVLLRREGLTFPLMGALVISVVVSIIIWISKR